MAARSRLVGGLRRAAVLSTGRGIPRRRATSPLARHAGLRRGLSDPALGHLYVARRHDLSPPGPRPRPSLARTARGLPRAHAVGRLAERSRGRPALGSHRRAPRLVAPAPARPFPATLDGAGEATPGRGGDPRVHHPHSPRPCPRRPRAGLPQRGRATRRPRDSNGNSRAPHPRRLRARRLLARPAARAPRDGAAAGLGRLVAQRARGSDRHAPAAPRPLRRLGARGLADEAQRFTRRARPMARAIRAGAEPRDRAGRRPLPAARPHVAPRGPPDGQPAARPDPRGLARARRARAAPSALSRLGHRPRRHRGLLPCSRRRIDRSRP